MKPYLIVCEITPMKVGEDYDMLPLHCTLVHWFWLDDNLPVDKLVTAIGVAFTTPVQLLLGKDEVFTAPTLGGDMPVHVTTIGRSSELARLHENICDLLDSLGVRYEKPEYIRSGWHPHVTHQDGEIIDAREYVSSNLYLVSADGPEYGYVRQIIAKLSA